jgi:hypothetical protein
MYFDTTALDRFRITSTERQFIMAKLLSGILGPVRGKVAGVVGGSWKGRNYIRSYAVPTPTNTTAQSNQRTDFAVAVAAAKYFVTSVFNPYYDKFLSGLSGYNKFIKENIADVVSHATLALPKVTSGPLYAGSALACAFLESNGTGTITWGDEHGVDGADTDVAIMWIRDKSTNQVLFGTPGTRVDAGASVGAADWSGKQYENIEAGVFFAKMNGDLVSKISTNLSVAATEDS